MLYFLLVLILFSKVMVAEIVFIKRGKLLQKIYFLAVHIDAIDIFIPVTPA